MQIIIPMSGFGERFRRVGYSVPKPLIEVDGHPIISHVIDMFPGETNFTFICNEDHLANPDYHMRDILNKYCPQGKIFGVKTRKLGPIDAVKMVFDHIDDTEPVVVNYCDFTCYWDWLDFKRFVSETGCDGAVPAYKGFHPHTLGTTNYAYIRETDGWMDDIQEKKPYTDNRMNEYASSGTYYFASGNIMKTCFDEAVSQGLDVNGEYYVSMAYKPLIANGGRSAVYELQHFMQWGTPADLNEYNGWSDTFRRLIEPAPPEPAPIGVLAVPMAGLGLRFSREGYATPKPLIEVSGRPMVMQAISDMPPSEKQVFVLRADMPGHKEISRELTATCPDSVVHTLLGVTEGQACTAKIAIDALKDAGYSGDGPVTFATCDNGVLYDQERFEALAGDPETDVIVWGVRGYANAIRKPQMFGWIDAEEGVIKGISVKAPLASPDVDPVVIGTFTFRRIADFERCVDRLIARDGRVNGEFYLDSCINDALALGLRCRLLEVHRYLSWGTPDELKTFEYWQSCFHKWQSHPYRLENDHRVPAGALSHLEERYQATVSPRPAPNQ